jgi:hypothetical protein
MSDAYDLDDPKHPEYTESLLDRADELKDREREETDE